MHSLEELGTIPKAKITQFNKRGIETIEALAEAFPRDYYDFRELTSVSVIDDKMPIALCGKIIQKRNNTKCFYYVVQLDDNTKFRVTWFNKSIDFNMYKEGDHIHVCGKASIWNKEIGITVPHRISYSKKDVLKIHPIYRKRSGISEKLFIEKMREAVEFMKNLPKDNKKECLAETLGKIPYIQAVEILHNPDSPENISLAKERIEFEKLYYFYQELNKKTPSTLSESLKALQNINTTRDFIDHKFPYDLTKGQVSAISSFLCKANKAQRVNSLVSGDVGCGKTAIAMICALLMVENGYQVAIMAPTLVLAKQHFEEFEKMLSEVRINEKAINIRFLSGKTRKPERNKIIAALNSGECNIIIGTHAVVSEDLVFHNLGLMIVDEEHKFGVMQKEKILNFNPAIHYMAMTATPIPRSIGMSIFGNDVELIFVDTMPSGRKPIITNHYFDEKEMFDKVMEQVYMGHQAYIIAPLIEKSESEKLEDVLSVEEAQEMFQSYLTKYHPNSDCVVASINGKMTTENVEEGIAKFAEKEADVLISTTIVEVGVNVPNATVICILSAGRFGLAALHQLRGRVGRNSNQGYCLLLHKEYTERLQIICNETNGFKIAEEDLRLRGPGDLVGESQKGMNEIIDVILSNKVLATTINEYFQK